MKKLGSQATTELAVENAGKSTVTRQAIFQKLINVTCRVIGTQSYFLEYFWLANERWYKNFWNEII